MSDATRARTLGVELSEEVPAWSTCTVTDAGGRFCDSPVPAGAPISACGTHLITAFRYCEELLDHAIGASDREAKSDEFARFHAWDARRINIERDRVVYYAVVGPYIKIGTSARLNERLKQLKADMLLATEPGGLAHEAERHAQFEHLRADVPRHNELFHPGADLIRHIERLASRRERRAA